MKCYLPWLGLAFTLTIAGCGGNSTKPSAEEPQAVERLYSLVALHGLTGDPAAGVVIPQPDDPKVVLGRALFFSRQLSGERDVACVSCHHPFLGGGDGLSLSIGVAAHEPEILGPGRTIDLARDGDPKALTLGGPNVPRNAQTIFNSALYRTTLFHDGRLFVLGTDASSGEQLIRTPESLLRRLPDPSAAGDLLAVQARFPVTSFAEMRGFGEFYALSSDQLRERIAERLRDASGSWEGPFVAAFGDPLADGAGLEALISYNNIAAALSAYQASKTFVDSPWAAFVRGDASAISAQQVRGAALFFASLEDGGLGCVGCHSGDRLTDERLHVAAIPQFGRGKRADDTDPGFFLVTQNDEDRYKFRTPGLLNISVTGPYGHSGAFDDLAEFVRYHADPVGEVERYDFSLASLSQFSMLEESPYPRARAMTEAALARVSPKLPLRPLREDELDAVVDFLNALTDPCVNTEECLMQWVADEQDDHDGQMLYPVIPNTPQHPEGEDGGSGPGDPVDPEEPGDPNDPGDPGDPVEPEEPEIDPSTAPFRHFTATTLCGHNLRNRMVDTAGHTGFVERAADSGLSHHHELATEAWRREFGALEAAMQSGAVLLAPINGDCWLDALFTTGGYGSAGLALYRNDMGRGFQAQSHALWQGMDIPLALGAADLNADYRIDLLVGNYLAGDVQVYQQGGGEGFVQRQSIPMSKSTFGFAFADIDGNGWLDAFIAHWDLGARPGAAPAMMKNMGANAFLGPTGVLYPYDVAAGTTGAQLAQNFNFSPAFTDLTGNGFPDLLLASDFETSEVAINNGNGSFSVITDRAVIVDENGMGSAIADFDNSGHFSWFVTSIHAPDDDREWPWGRTGNKLYTPARDTDFPFAQQATHGAENAGWAWGACAADFNNNGYIDLFVENGYGLVPDAVRAQLSDDLLRDLDELLAGYHQQLPRLFINQGDGTFVDEASSWGITAPTNGRGVVCADIDRDGDIDIVVAQNIGPPLLFENQLPGQGAVNFLSVSLVADRPNTQAIGAVVRARTGEITRMRQVEANSGYLGQTPTALHFGLGADTQVDEIRITWHDGREEVLQDVPANRFLTFRHPDLNPLSSSLLHDGMADVARDALAWLESNENQVPADVLLGLTWMQRQFGIAPAFSPTALLEDLIAHETDAAMLASLLAYRRFYDPDHTLPAEALSGLVGLDEITIAPLYCHEHALGTDYLGRLLALSASEDAYEVSHALFAYLLLTDNACPLRLPAADVEQLVLRNLALVQPGGEGIRDIDIEAMAFIAAAGRSDLISPAWLHAFMDAQRQDGGFAFAQEDGDSNAHATGLALWLALQLTHSNQIHHGLIAQHW
ncbi:FG-GAP-like repeat-containing protein [Alcanivorax sp. JB21]|uniref:FG-GAP-like repeat-containing protein n=1 Tax=Alcanivorax limicola TaxID=2874102 RepID=UPI0021D8B998|nr:FG-GAP-like repeat-containing protein [Alcanivorax limicola]MBZ2187929.1 FG-GAP-like repeat-containing protein [Alcanivorax limicola]